MRRPVDVPEDDVPTVSIADIRVVLDAVLEDEHASARLEADSPLLDAHPELDSIAIVNLILALEERFGIEVDDDEVERSLFATPGALRDFAAAKLRRDGTRRGGGTAAARG